MNLQVRIILPPVLSLAGCQLKRREEMCVCARRVMHRDREEDETAAIDDKLDSQVSMEYRPCSSGDNTPEISTNDYYDLIKWDNCECAGRLSARRTISTMMTTTLKTGRHGIATERLADHHGSTGTYD